MRRLGLRAAFAHHQGFGDRSAPDRDLHEHGVLQVLRLGPEDEAGLAVVLSHYLEDQATVGVRRYAELAHGASTYEHALDLRAYGDIQFLVGVVVNGQRGLGVVARRQKSR